MKKILFIGGTGRCGTSILNALIGAHKNCHSLNFKSRFTVDPAGIYQFLKDHDIGMTPYVYNNRVHEVLCFLHFLSSSKKKSKKLTYNKFELNKFFPNYKKALKKLVSNFKKNSYIGNWLGQNYYCNYKKNLIFLNQDKNKIINYFKQFLHDVYLKSLDNEKKYFIDANTWNFFYLKEICSLELPVKFLLIERNPADTINSFIKQRWSPSSKHKAKSFYENLTFIIRKNIRKKFNNSNKHMLLKIKYEDLIIKSDATIKKVHKFLNVANSNEYKKIRLYQNKINEYYKF